MKYASLCLLLSLLTAPAMADNLLNRMVDFGREVLDETRKLAPGIQNDRRHEQAAQLNQAAPDDGRHSPAIELGPVSSAESASLPPPASPSANHGWQFVEEDHLKGQ
ncbi:hypothetical protein [Zobellella sp. An-6]|uniref:hypothetical protein n=1 Tax=Zobellella sp. An-6 TaxID=3400218 RepID=UPI00404128D4